MRLNSFQLARRYRPKRLLVFVGLVGVLALATAQGSLAQNPQPSSGIFIPLFIDGQVAAEQNSVHVHDHTHDHVGHIPIDGQFTGNDGQEMSWPPQVKDLQEVVWDSGTTVASAGQISAADLVVTTASSNVEIEGLLGERYTFISANEIQEKWEDEVTGHTVTFFSYSSNLTIEAIVINGIVDRINTYVATDYQPPLRKNEVADAITIAREYWQQQGNSRVNDLQGFTIQTFETDGDGGYYDVRMSYVSFHVDEVSDPELLTWVDLTNQAVVRAAIDEGGVLHEQ